MSLIASLIACTPSASLIAGCASLCQGHLGMGSPPRTRHLERRSHATGDQGAVAVGGCAQMHASAHHGPRFPIASPQVPLQSGDALVLKQVERLMASDGL